MDRAQARVLDDVRWCIALAVITGRHVAIDFEQRNTASDASASTYSQLAVQSLQLHMSRTRVNVRIYIRPRRAHAEPCDATGVTTIVVGTAWLHATGGCRRRKPRTLHLYC